MDVLLSLIIVTLLITIAYVVSLQNYVDTTTVETLENPLTPEAKNNRLAIFDSATETGYNSFIKNALGASTYAGISEIESPIITDSGLSSSQVNGPPVLIAREPGEYVFYPHMNTTNNDIVSLDPITGETRSYKVDGKIDDMKKACNDMEECVGFDSDGVLKSKINSTNMFANYSNATQGLYVQPSRTPANMFNRGYDRFASVTSTSKDGNDIIASLDPATLTVEQLGLYCDVTPDCVAYDNTGNLMRKVSPRAQWTYKTKGNDLYTLRAPSPIPKGPSNFSHAYDFYPLIDDPGRDDYADILITHSENNPIPPVAKLQEECDNDENCVAFSSRGYLKSSVSPHPIVFPDISPNSDPLKDGLYVRSDRSYPQHTYVTHQNTTVPNATAQRRYPLNSVSKVCDVLSDCRGYTDDGSLIQGDLQTVITQPGRFIKTKGGPPTEAIFDNRFGP